MKEMDLCVIVTKAEWEKIIADKKLCLAIEKDSFVKGDVLLHEGRPYLCKKNTKCSTPIGHSDCWKAIKVQH